MSAKEMVKKNVITMVNAKMALENTNAYAMMITLEHIVTSLKNLAVETSLVKTALHVMKLECNRTVFLSSALAHKVRKNSINQYHFISWKKCVRELPNTYLYTHFYSGWEGEFCSERIDFCKDAQCDNGDCENTLYGYKCNCILGFAGIHCEVNIDECNPNPCKNEGRCIDGVNAFTCNCTDTGFNGMFATKIDCYNAPFNNNQHLCT